MTYIPPLCTSIQLLDNIQCSTELSTISHSNVDIPDWSGNITITSDCSINIMASCSCFLGNDSNITSFNFYCYINNTKVSTTSFFFNKKTQNNCFMLFYSGDIKKGTYNINIKMSSDGIVYVNTTDYCDMVVTLTRNG